MSEFKVRVQDLYGVMDSTANLERILFQISGDVQSVRRNLQMEVRQRERINSRLNQSIDRLKEEGQSVARMVRTGRQAAALYERTETELLSMSTRPSSSNSNKETSDASFVSMIMGWWKSFVQWLEDLFTPSQPTNTEIDSIVFDENGQYGGDQGSPRRKTLQEKEELYDVVREYHPDYTDAEIARYLNKLNSEGCGYVAVVNTILASFEGREKEFEQKFGFSMYDDNGNLNYDRLLVDYYAATDNHNKGWFGRDRVDNKEDYSKDDDGKKSSYNYRMDSTGAGTSQSDREYRTHLYLDKKGVSVKVKNHYHVTPENFSKASENGYIIISYHDGKLLNADGSEASVIDGGHAMVVTGVTEDGRYIVSSWGEKYYIDPNEKYKIDGRTTQFSFSYYQYN